jgi:hypothetical protein
MLIVTPIANHTQLVQAHAMLAETGFCHPPPDMTSIHEYCHADDTITSSTNSILCRTLDTVQVTGDASSLMLVQAFKPFYSSAECSSDGSSSSAGSDARVVDTVVVNLQRATDKWRDILEQVKGHGFNLSKGNFRRFAAVDGKLLRLSPGLLHLFRTTHPRGGFGFNPHEGHGMRRGVLGCTLSHLAIWREIESRSDYGDADAVLVLEDDAVLADDFRTRWPRMWARAKGDPRWDVMFLGFTDDKPLYGR